MQKQPDLSGKCGQTGASISFNLTVQHATFNKDPNFYVSTVLEVSSYKINNHNHPSGKFTHVILRQDFRLARLTCHFSLILIWKFKDPGVCTVIGVIVETPLHAYVLFYFNFNFKSYASVPRLFEYDQGGCTQLHEDLKKGVSPP